MFQELLGEFVKNKRKEMNLTQDQLAEKIGKDQAYIYRLESGKQVGSIKTLIDVAVALETRPGKLLDILAGAEDELESKRFLWLPRNFSKMDAELIEGVAGLLSEFIERERKPKPDAKDTWLNDREEAG